MTRHFSGAEAAGDGMLVIDFGKLIRLDSDPTKQAFLRRMLIEEEDKLAANREQLEKRIRLAAKAREQIGDGRVRLGRLNGIKSPGNALDYRRSVELMETMQQLFENFQSRLRSIYPYSVKIQDEVVGVCTTLEEARRRAEQFAEANSDVVITVLDERHGRSETFHRDC